jgi:hypothetical protein
MTPHFAARWLLRKRMDSMMVNTHENKRANKGAAGNAVGRLAVCGVKRFGDRAVTPHANRFAGMSRASASEMAFSILLRSAPPRARA